MVRGITDNDTEFRSEDNEFTSTDIGTTENTGNREPISGEVNRVNIPNFNFTEPTKRGRGRPKGSKNRTKDGTSEKETIGLSEETLGKKSEYKPPKKKFLSTQEAQSTANFVLGTIQSLAMQVLGEQAKYNEVENLLLSLSLPKYLETLELSTLEHGLNMMYPIAGILGFSMYALRLGNIFLEQRKLQKEQQEQQEQEQSNNGKEDNINWNKQPIDLTKSKLNF